MLMATGLSTIKLGGNENVVITFIVVSFFPFIVEP